MPRAAGKNRGICGADSPLRFRSSGKEGLKAAFLSGGEKTGSGRRSSAFGRGGKNVRGGGNPGGKVCRGKEKGRLTLYNT